MLFPERGMANCRPRGASPCGLFILLFWGRMQWGGVGVESFFDFLQTVGLLKCIK